MPAGPTACQDELRLGFRLCGVRLLRWERAPASRRRRRFACGASNQCGSGTHRWGLLQPSLQRTMPGVQRRGLRSVSASQSVAPARGTPALRERRFSLRAVPAMVRTALLCVPDRACRSASCTAGVATASASCNGAVPARQRHHHLQSLRLRRHGRQRRSARRTPLRCRRLLAMRVAPASRKKADGLACGEQTNAEAAACRTASAATRPAAGSAGLRRSRDRSANASRSARPAPACACAASGSGICGGSCDGSNCRCAYRRCSAAGRVARRA